VIDDAVTELLADELAAAAEQGRPVEPLVARYPDLDLAGAYAVQCVLVRRWTDAGNRVVAHEIGLTSAAV
jgi:2-keto-4-pentenoate hydratase